MRQVLLRRRCMGTNKQEYIQDGLIGWFDGEWNRDIGVHDSVSTTWVNLVDKERNITQIDNRFTWGDNYLLPPEVARVGYVPSFNEARTIEAVIKFVGTGFIPVINHTSFENQWLALRANNTVNFRSGGLCAPCPRNQLVAISGVDAGTYYSAQAAKIFINGDNKTNGGGATGSATPNCFNSNFSWGYGTSYFYCLRFYNRNLTEEEVIHNFEIDKKRFNIIV